MFRLSSTAGFSLERQTDRSTRSTPARDAFTGHTRLLPEYESHPQLETGLSISATSIATYTHWTRTPACCAGECALTSIQARSSPARPSSIADGCMCPSREETNRWRQRILNTSAVPSEAVSWRWMRRTARGSGKPILSPMSQRSPDKTRPARRPGDLRASLPGRRQLSIYRTG